MPIICMFYGITIEMYFGDHAPPHFHARYSGNEVLIDIRTFEVLNGKMAPRARKLVLEWALLHRAELEENWRRVEAREALRQIAPLE